MTQWRGSPRRTSLTALREAEPGGESSTGASLWLAPGEGFVVDGRRVEGGMVYVGSGLRAVGGYSTEPCLIDPDKPVRWKDADHSGDSMEYWPSYSLINPRARGAYLHWLAEGRRAPDAYIGYVFLFFYGLERRALFDLGPDSRHPDMKAVTTEVERLMEVYGENGSFRRRSANFLDFLAASRMSDPDEQLPSSPIGGHRARSAVLVGVGRHVAESRMVPADWALGYFRLHPEGWKRTAATRCGAEFDDLFRLRYQERFNGGLRPRPHRNLHISYRPASPGFGDMPRRADIRLPDITSDWNAVRSMRTLAEECALDLDVYSRYIGRHPDGRNAPAARALLPDDLLDNHPSLLSGWHDWLASALSEKRLVELPFRKVLDVWSPHLAGKIVKRDAVLLSLMLARVGVGVEPDVRFGAPPPRPDGRAVLFRLIEGDEGGVRSPALDSLSSLAHLTAVVARVGGGSASDSWERLLGVIGGAPLGIDEMTRVEARFRLIFSKNPGMAGIKSRVDGVPAGERLRVGRFLVEVAASEGEVNPKATSALGRIFGYLGIEEVEVFRILYSLGAGEPKQPERVKDPHTEAPSPMEAEAKPEMEAEDIESRRPVDLRAPHTEVREHPDERKAAIPKGRAPSPVTDLSQPGATLDLQKIANVLESTARASEMLAEIFDDEEEWEEEPMEIVEEASEDGDFDPVIEGLDRVHARLVERIIARQSWERSALEGIAGVLGIPLLGGALDLINEITLDICDEPLVEGEDPVAVNAYALEELFE